MTTMPQPCPSTRGEYTYLNQKGDLYYLNSKITRRVRRVVKGVCESCGGKKYEMVDGIPSQVPLYFFSKDRREATTCSLPDGYDVHESERANMPYLKKDLMGFY